MKITFCTFFLTAVSFTANAQNWLIAGNSNITTSNFLGTTNKQPLIVKTNNAERLRILANGNIGVGTAKPENQFHIFKGSAGAVTGYVNAPLIVENSTHSFINILAPDNAETGILFGKPSDNPSGGIIYNEIGDPNGFQFRTNGNVTQMVLNSAGNLGIGTTSPSYKLSVNGTIQSKEVRVETGWADYVFEDDYKLRSLDNVAEYIKQNKHLPGIPSTKEIQDNGLAVGEMQTKMMAKIEELTLYIIQLQKEVDGLKMNK